MIVTNPDGPMRRAEDETDALVDCRRSTRTRRVPLQLVTGTDVPGPCAGDEESLPMTSWADAIDAWTISIQAAGRAPRSIRLYRYHLLRVSRAVPEGPGAVTTADLRQILATPGWSPETRKSNRTPFVVFFRWLAAEGLIDDDPAARLDPVSVPAGVPRPAPEDVIARALAEADTRVRAMIMLAAFAGLRCCEIAGVHTDDWDGEGLYVTGKGGKRRYIPVVRDDVKALLRQAKRGYLFPGKIDGHLGAQRVSVLISRALPDGWTAHTLRHRCATKMFAGTHDLLAVGAVLGHARPETTQRYVRLPDDSLRAAIAAAA